MGNTNPRQTKEKKSEIGKRTFNSHESKSKHRLILRTGDTLDCEKYITFRIINVGRVAGEFLAGILAKFLKGIPLVLPCIIVPQHWQKNHWQNHSD